MGTRSIPLAEKVQNLLISDFLNYMALRHQIFMSSMSQALKKAYDEAVANSGLIDPLAELEIDIQSFDIPRLVSVYPDKSGIRWWTKAWFNNSESGEAAIEIDRQLAIKFINDNIEKRRMARRVFPKQMEVYHNTIEQIGNRYSVNLTSKTKENEEDIFICPLYTECFCCRCRQRNLRYW